MPCKSACHFVSVAEWSDVMAGVWQRELHNCALLRLIKSYLVGGGKLLIYPLFKCVFTLNFCLALCFTFAPVHTSYLSLGCNGGGVCRLSQIFSFDRALAEEIVPRVKTSSVSSSVNAGSVHESSGHAGINQKEQSLFAPIEALFVGEVDVSGPPVAEVFTGVDFTQNQIGFYAGGVTGALGPHMSIDGLKLRAVYGQGYYKYVSSKVIGGTSVNVEFQGTSEFYEAMVGYEFRFMGSIYKAYGGLISETNHIDPNDLNNSLEGTNVGLKVLLEGWHEFADGGWLSAYGAYSSGSEYYVLHGRYGRAVSPALAVGLEAGVFGNKEFDALRFGGFSRYKIGKAEITISAGISGDYDQPDAVYGTMQYYTKIHSLQDFLP